MSIIRADSIKNRSGAGAPDFPNGITVTGIVTATNLNSVTNNVDVDDFISVGNNIHLGNAGVVTATSFVGNISGTTGAFTGAVSGSTGTFTGNVSVGGTLTYEDVKNVDSIGIVTARSGLRVPDNVYSYFGTGNDLSIRHDASGGNHSYIFNHGAGVFKLGSDTQFILGKTSNATYIQANPDSDVKLYFNNSPKLATTNTGVTVTGTVAATAYTGDGSALTGIDATTIQTGNNKVQTSATGIANIIGNAGIATITAQGLNVTGIVTATSMKVFDSGIDYEWQGGTSTAWWKSEDIVSTSSWPAAKGGSNANLVSHNGGTNGLSYNATDTSFNGHKSLEQGGNNPGGLRTSNQTDGYWWNGTDAFTVIMAIVKQAHQSGSSYGDSYFVHNVNTGNANQSWSIGPYGDHTWGGEYGETWGGLQNYFEGLEQRFSYPWRGLFMVRMNSQASYAEISVNGGSGWQRIDLRHSLPSNIGTTWKGMSIFCNSNGETGHTARGRIAEWAYFRNKRLGGNELDAITKSWCNKFNF